MAQPLIIIMLAFAIGLAYLLWIRRKDQFEKEPFGKLFIAFFWGGILSVIMSLMLYKFIDAESTFVDAILKIGPIEEISKLLALVITYRFFKKDFNEPTDGLVYMSAVALGFSTIENVFYAFNSTTPYGLLALRSVICVLGHISFSSYMGIAFYIHTQTKRNLDGIFIAFVIASLAHGLYDGFIFEPGLSLFMLLLWITLVVFLFIFFNLTLSLSPFKKRFNESEFKETGYAGSLVCINCENAIQSNQKTFETVKFSICESCEFVAVDHDQVIKLFKYFRPGFKRRRFFNSLPSQTIQVNLDTQGHIKYHHEHKTLSAQLVSLELWLHNFGKMGVREKIQTKLTGKIFNIIGANKLLES